MPQRHNTTFSLTMDGDRALVLRRTFAAPRALVFKALSSCEHLSHWLGPREMVMTACEMDFRSGGSYTYTQRAPDGSDYTFRGDILEVVPPERVVQTFEFMLMPGHISTETMTLEEHDGMTTMTVRSVYQSPADRDGQVQSGMEAGVRDSYDRLEEYVATLGE